MEKFQADKLPRLEKYLRELRKSHLIEILGPNLKKPIPEDFELDSNQLSIAQSDYIENQKIEIENKKILAYERQSNFLKYGHIIGFLVAYLFFPRVKKLGILGINYAKYLEAEKAYKEVLEDIEKEKIEELRRKEADYWFSLGGHEFEEEVSKLFRRSGHFSSVEKTKGSGDGGIDIILTVSDGTKIFVQCKAHKSSVGPHVARDLYGAMQSAGVNNGIIINLAGFTQAVRDFIKGKNISLFDVNSVIEMQNTTPPKNKQRVNKCKSNLQSEKLPNELINAAKQGDVAAKPDESTENSSAEQRQAKYEADLAAAQAILADEEAGLDNLPPDDSGAGVIEPTGGQPPMPTQRPIVDNRATVIEQQAQLRAQQAWDRANAGLETPATEVVPPQETIEAYKQAIKINPDDAEAHSCLGDAYRELRRWQEAIESYKQAIRIKPDLAKAHGNLGLTYASLSRWQDSIEACKKAIKIKPDCAEAHCCLGGAYFIIGDKGSALEEYKILKTLNAEQANELFNLIYQ